MSLILLFAVSPTMVVARKVIGVPTGAQVQLECAVEAYPNAINYWLKSEEAMILAEYVNALLGSRCFLV